MANVIVGKEGGVGGGAWADLPADVYDAVLDSYEERLRPLDQYNDDPEAMRLTLKFQLADETDDDGNPIQMLHWVNKTLSPKANLAPILDALGVPWGPGKETDLDDMVGKTCRLVVGRKPNKDQTGDVAFVQSVVPAKALTPDKPKRPTAQKPAAVEEDAPVCVIPKCGKPLSQFDADGNAYCAKHASLIDDAE